MRTIQERTRSLPRRLGNARGFTLIELMVVVAIIGILAAIAASHLLTYRLQAFDAQANTDLRNAANCEEAYFLDVGAYLSCADASCESGLPNFRRSKAVSITMTAAAGPSPSFTGIAASTPGTRVFTWDSTQGGFTN